MDAAEIARLRERGNAARSVFASYVSGVSPDYFLPLLDALEQAQKERDLEETLRIDCQSANSGLVRLLSEARTQRDAAQQDAKDARALLEELTSIEDADTIARRWIYLRARIEALLEKKL